MTRRAPRFRHTLWDAENRRHVLVGGTDHPERELEEAEVDVVVLERANGTVWRPDPLHSGEEERILGLGMSANGRILRVAVAGRPLRAARPVHGIDASPAEKLAYLRGRRR